MAVAADTAVVGATVASEEATKTKGVRCSAVLCLLAQGRRLATQTSLGKNWAGLDSNQRRRKASRFTVCPVWPLRNLPVGANLI
jgi:hypothetical protein